MKQAVTIGGRTLELSLAKPFTLSDSSKRDSIPLSAEEVCIFLNRQHGQADWRSDTMGIELAGVDASENRSAIHSLRSQLPFPRHAVLIDGSTLQSATLALEQPSPINLLDLATLINAFIFYDQIVLQPGLQADFLGDNDDVFLVLGYDKTFVSSVLWPLAAATLNTMNNREDSYAIELNNIWNDFLGFEQSPYRLGLVQSHQRSPNYWDGVAATEYVTELVQTAFFNKQELTASGNEFLAVQTYRALFNDDLAGLLKIPYLATTMRSPVHSRVLSEKCALPSAIEAWTDQVAPEVIGGRPSDLPAYCEFTAPFLLAVALRRMNKPSDLFPVLRELRDSFAPLRSFISARKHEWNGRSSSFAYEISSEIDAITERCKLGDKTVHGVIAAVPAIATSTPTRTAWANLLSKFGILLTPIESLRDWYLKTFRPELHVTTNLAQEATQLRAIQHEVSRLWPNANWRRRELEMLTLFSNSRPERSLRVRNLWTG